MIHICVHCYAEKLLQYAVFLRAQLSSLVLYESKHPSKITVCHSSSDDATISVLDEFQQLLGGRLSIKCLDKGYLFRRAIGRNIVALETEADILWHTDVDHIFKEGCLDALWDIWSCLKTKPGMWFPKTILVHPNHSEADVFWQSHLIGPAALLDPDVSKYIPKINYKPIGGIQIVDGKFARRHGYLNQNGKWLTPVSEDKPFPEFRDDVKYRNFCLKNGGLQSGELPNLFRLRHTEVTYK